MQKVFKGIATRKEIDKLSDTIYGKASRLSGEEKKSQKSS